MTFLDVITSVRGLMAIFDFNYVLYKRLSSLIKPPGVSLIETPQSAESPLTFRFMNTHLLITHSHLEVWGWRFRLFCQLSDWKHTQEVVWLNSSTEAVCCAHITASVKTNGYEINYNKIRETQTYITATNNKMILIKNTHSLCVFQEFFSDGLKLIRCRLEVL